jgi:TolB-like protein/Tfp pilus assembly protein PilF
MTTGTRPFAGNTSAAIISSILTDTPSSIARLRRDVPSRLESIVERCLEKDVSRRYPDAGEVRADLEGLKRDITSTTGRPRSGATTVSKARPMIVVLPFENLGPAEDEYFAEGISEEITSRLSTVGELGVISRTTASQYDRGGKTMRQVGRDLGVDYVIEGTVRWARSSTGPSRVRITPQLVRVADDTNLWTERYDRVMEDIFEIQSDIAEKVAEHMGVTLLDSEREALGARPTENLEAYEAYLKGKAAMYGFSEDAFKAAIAAYERATELDPGFLEAYVGLVASHSRMYFLNYDRTENRKALAKRALDGVFAAGPESPQFHLAVGYYHYHIDRDYETADKAFAVALEANPNNAEVLAARGYLQRRQGRWDSAVANLDRAMVLDPTNGQDMWNHATSYVCLGKYDKAHALFERSQELLPEEGLIYYFKAMNYRNWTGSTDDMRRALADMPLDGNPWYHAIWYWTEVYSGKFARALEIIEEVDHDIIDTVPTFQPKFFLKGVARRLMGDKDRAAENFDAARVLLEAVRKADEDRGPLHSCLAICYAALGRESDSIDAMEKAKDIYPMAVDAITSPFIEEQAAWAYTYLGHREKAIASIDAVLSVPSVFSIRAFEINPIYDPLRDHPEYKELVKKHS